MCVCVCVCVFSKLLMPKGSQSVMQILRRSTPHIFLEDNSFMSSVVDFKLSFLISPGFPVPVIWLMMMKSHVTDAPLATLAEGVRRK